MASIHEPQYYAGNPRETCLQQYSGIRCALALDLQHVTLLLVSWTFFYSLSSSDEAQNITRE